MRIWFVIPGWIIVGALLLLTSICWYATENIIGILYVVLVLINGGSFMLWSIVRAFSSKKIKIKLLSILSLLTLLLLTTVCLTIFTATTVKEILKVNLLICTIGTISAVVTRESFKKIWLGIIVFVLIIGFVITSFTVFLNEEERKNKEFIEGYMNNVAITYMVSEPETEIYSAEDNKRGNDVIGKCVKGDIVENMDVTQRDGGIYDSYNVFRLIKTKEGIIGFIRSSHLKKNN